MGTLAESTPLTQPAPFWSTLCIASAGLALSPWLPFSVTLTSRGSLAQPAGTGAWFPDLLPLLSSPPLLPPQTLSLLPQTSLLLLCHFPKEIVHGLLAPLYLPRWHQVPVLGSTCQPATATAVRSPVGLGTVSPLGPEHHEQSLWPTFPQGRAQRWVHSGSSASIA